MDIILLDGGMGQELVRRSSDPAHPQWSAHVMRSEPEIVQAVHEDYLRAGSTMLTLNSYSVTRGRFRRLGVEEEFAPLQKRSIDLANAARDVVGVEASIAGCLPPLEGSYKPEMDAGFEELVDEYREIVEIEAPHVDVFMCETMSTAIEAKAAAMAACDSGKPVWVAWTLAEKPADDGTARLRSGETIDHAIAMLDGLPVAGLMFNCCPPEMMTLGMPKLAAEGRVFGGHANGFTHIPPEFVLGATVSLLSARQDLNPMAYADQVMGWVDQGATIIGGCCEVGPAHIAELSRRINTDGHRAVAA